MKREMKKQLLGTIAAGLIGFGLVGLGVVAYESRVRRTMTRGRRAESDARTDPRGDPRGPHRRGAADRRPRPGGRGDREDAGQLDAAVRHAGRQGRHW